MNTQRTARARSGTLRSLAVTAGGVAALTVLASCAAPQVEVPPDVRAAIASLSVLPSDLYIAHGIITTDCLNDAGFDVPFDASASLTNVTRHVAVGVVGVFPSEQSAHDYGYNTTFAEEGYTSMDSFQAALPESDRVAFDEAMWGPEGSPAETLTMDNGMEFGKSTVGCVAEADKAVYGSVRGAMELELFTNDVSTQTNNHRGDFDATLQALMPSYEECMAEAGHQLEGLNAPEVAESKFGRYRPSGAAPSQDEQEMAVADFRCQEAVDLATALNTVFVDKASVWLVENEDRILQLRESLQGSLDRAQDVINDET
jgi:hypothetical protein